MSQMETQWLGTRRGGCVKTTVDQIEIDGQNFDVSIVANNRQTNCAAKIVIPVLALNQAALDVATVSIKSVIQKSIEPVEIWVVDNNSPPTFRDKLAQLDGVNFVFNHTEPYPSYGRTPPTYYLRRCLGLLNKNYSVGLQMFEGAYANGVALELGCKASRLTDQLVFVMHSDTLIIKDTWLSFLRSKMTDRIRAVGCWKDRIRVQALHIGALLFDYSLYESLQMSFLPNIGRRWHPNEVEHDVGDLISLKLLEHGYDLFCCQNTYNDPETVHSIRRSDPLRTIHSDRCFDDAGDVFLAHMGRGVPKSIGRYKKHGKTYPNEWVEYANKYVLEG